MARILGTVKIIFDETQMRQIESAINEGTGKLVKQAHELCLEIENLPAGEQQTKVSILASKLFQELHKASEFVFPRIINV